MNGEKRQALIQALAIMLEQEGARRPKTLAGRIMQLVELQYEPPEMTKFRVLPEGGWEVYVQSSTNADRWHRVVINAQNTGGTCSCPQYENLGAEGVICKHIIAARAILGLMRRARDHEEHVRAAVAARAGQASVSED
jgi:hypothetical protein